MPDGLTGRILRTYADQLAGVFPDIFTDYRERMAVHAHIHVEGAVVEWVESMVQTHQHDREEGTTTPLPPQEAEKIWHGPSDPQKVIQLHH